MNRAGTDAGTDAGPDAFSFRFFCEQVHMVKDSNRSMRYFFMLN